LHIGVLTDLNAIDIASDDTAKPNGTIVSYADITNDICTRSNKDAVSNGWRNALKCHQHP
jgi:isocitrate/isopropylmalate dehydrogenase